MESDHFYYRLEHSHMWRCRGDAHLTPANATAVWTLGSEFVCKEKPQSKLNLAAITCRLSKPSLPWYKKRSLSWFIWSIFLTSSTPWHYYLFSLPFSTLSLSPFFFPASLYLCFSSLASSAGESFSWQIFKASACALFFPSPCADEPWITCTANKSSNMPGWHLTWWFDTLCSCAVVRCSCFLTERENRR